VVPRTGSSSRCGSSHVRVRARTFADRQIGNAAWDTSKSELKSVHQTRGNSNSIATACLCPCIGASRPSRSGWIHLGYGRRRQEPCARCGLNRFNRHTGRPLAKHEPIWRGLRQGNRAKKGRLRRRLRSPRRASLSWDPARSIPKAAFAPKCPEGQPRPRASSIATIRIASRMFC